MSNRLSTQCRQSIWAGALILLTMAVPGETSEDPLASLAECKGPVWQSTPPKFKSHPAVNCSDEFAWDLFIKLNHPAAANSPGEPDETKKLGDPGQTVWETWKLRNDVFREDGCKPAPWGGPVEVASAAPRLPDPGSKAELVASRILDKFDLPDAQLVFDPNRPSGETRLNRAAFDFIIANELYTIEGQEAFHANAVTIDFPPEAREIKSAWRVLTENEIAGGAKERGHYFRLGNH